MLFGKRRWSVRVAKAADLKVGGPVAVEVVDLLVAAAKAGQALAGDRAGELDDLDYVMQAARALPADEAAVERLCSRIGLPGDEANRLLKATADAALRVYADQGRELGAPRPGRAREPWPPGHLE